MQENKKKHVNHNPKPKTEVAPQKHAARARLAPEVASPIVATTIPVARSAIASPSDPTGATHPAIPQTTPVIPAASSSETDVSPAVGATNQPPDVTSPTVPPGFVASTSRRGRGASRFTTNEIKTMPQVVADLGNVSAIALLLGSYAPNVPAISADITVGLKWRALRVAAENWAQYVTDGDQTAWQPVATALEKIRPLFLGAAAIDSSVTHTFPGLTAFFAAQAAPAKSAAATRKRNAKAKNVTQTKAAQAAAGTATSADATATTPKVTINT